MIHFFKRLSFEQGNPRTAGGMFFYAIIDDDRGLHAEIRELNGEHFMDLSPIWCWGKTDLEGIQDGIQRHYERSMWHSLSPEVQTLIKKHYPTECMRRGIDLDA